jgi:hypothetical protein
LASLADFSISLESRYLLGQVAYDPVSHRYDPDYVDPTRNQQSMFAYRLRLDATPGFFQSPSGRSALVPFALNLSLGRGPRTIDDLLSPKLGGSGEGGGGPGSGQRPPSDVQSYEWMVERLSGGFTTTVRLERDMQGFWQTVVAVPSEGRYRVTLRVELDDGSVLTQTRDFLAREFLVGLIGDSFASGEGNPTAPGTASITVGSLQCDSTTFSIFLKNKLSIDINMSNAPVWLEPKAHRSYRSGHSVAIGMLESTTERVGTVITYLDMARSGAQIARGLIAPNDGDVLDIGQIGEMRRTVGSRRLDALVISIGGNDLGFSGRISDLVESDFSWWPLSIGKDDNAARVKFQNTVDARLGTLENDYRALRDTIGAELNPRHVYITTYPTGLFEKTVEQNGQIEVKDGGPCGVFEGPDLDLDESDGRAIKEEASKLNDLIRRVAREFDWFVIDGVAEGFAGHGYCDDDTFWVSAEQSCRTQGDFDGMLHPNGRGHAVVAQLVSAALRENLIPRVPIGPTTGPPPVQPVGEKTDTPPANGPVTPVPPIALGEQDSTTE